MTESDNDNLQAQSLTTAVIVAAGKGSRLNSADMYPKPLISVAGVPLIARVMASASRAGIKRFIVVIGYQADLMREALPRLLPKGCVIEMVYNSRFEQPNGVSLMAATCNLADPFVLLMSDHIFSPGRLDRAIRDFLRRPRSLLVVESRDGFDGDIHDATLVKREGSRIREIGKGLNHSDAIDTGMFILNPAELSQAFNQTKEPPGISDLMQIMAAEGKLEALETDQGYWQDVDTPQDLAAAEKKLYSSLAKSTDGALARLINRRVSLFMSTRLWRAGIGPNTVTAFTLGLGILAGIAFALGSDARWGLLGATLFQLQSIIDGVDGELARLLLKESPFGYWFDLVSDNLTHMAVFAGIAMGQQADHIPGPWNLLGIMAVLGVAASFAAMAPLLRPDSARKGPKTRIGLLKKLVEGLSRRDFTYLLFPLAALEWLGYFLWAAAIGTWIYAAIVIFLRSGQRLGRNI